MISLILFSKLYLNKSSSNFRPQISACRLGQTIDGNCNLQKKDGIIEEIDGEWCQTEPSGRGLVE
jgi:hypothetical protein